MNNTQRVCLDCGKELRHPGDFCDAKCQHEHEATLARFGVKPEFRRRAVMFPPTKKPRDE